MTLSSAPWWCAPVLALAWIWTVPAQIFCAPTRAKLIAAARFMPGVCGVLVSSWSPGMTLTPLVFQSMPLVSCGSLIALFPDPETVPSYGCAVRSSGGRDAAIGGSTLENEEVALVHRQGYIAAWTVCADEVF